MQEKPGVFAGIDWASVEHQVCLMGGGPPVQRTFAHDALAVRWWTGWSARPIILKTSRSPSRRRTARWLRR